MSPHSTRNTSIRTRKIRGEDSLLSSISISEREEWPEGICGCHPLRKAALGNQYGTAGWRKKLGSRDFGQTMVEPLPETRLRHQRILERFVVQPGFFMTALYLAGPAAVPASLSVATEDPGGSAAPSSGYFEGSTYYGIDEPLQSVLCRREWPYELRFRDHGHGRAGAAARCHHPGRHPAALLAQRHETRHRECGKRRLARR